AAAPRIHAPSAPRFSAPAGPPRLHASPRIQSVPRVAGPAHRVPHARTFAAPRSGFTARRFTHPNVRGPATARSLNRPAVHARGPARSLANPRPANRFTAAPPSRALGDNRARTDTRGNLTRSTEANRAVGPGNVRSARAVQFERTFRTFR